MFGIFGGNKRKKAEDLNEAGLKFAYSNNLQAALDKFLEAIKVDPEYHDAYGNAANCYRYTHQPQKAIEYYTKSLEIKPDFAEGTYNRAVVYETLDQLPQAIADYEFLQKSGGDKKLGMEQKLAEEIIVLRTRLLIRTLKQDMSPLPPAQAMTAAIQDMFTKATELFKQRQYPAVIDLSTKAISVDSGQVELLNLRGASFLATGRLEGAAPDIYRALRLSPDHVPALANRASLLKRVELYDDALTDLNRLVQLKPTDVIFYTERADVYQKLSKLDEALQNWDAAVKLGPGDANTHFYRGITLNQMNKFAEAIAEYSETLRLNINFVEAFTSRALAYAALGRFKEGIADLETYIQQGAHGRMTMEQAKSNLAAMQKSVR